MNLILKDIFFRLIISSLLFIMSFKSIAQMTIQFPAERSIFQRNNQNFGSIFISGNLTTEADKVEGRLLPRVTGQGTPTNWITIDDKIDGLSFTGKIDGLGGWYRLELRSIFNGQSQQVNVVERVGIGEVFVIAGQSNAQGDGDNANPNGASDDRVNAFGPDYFDHNTALVGNFPEVLPLNQFVQISKTTFVGPMGYTAWCWGELGDKLVAKLNVPVMFINAALTGTSTNNWVASIDGFDTYHIFTGLKLQRFFPYIGVRRVLHNTTSFLGIRAILWHQGEFEYNIPEVTQVSNLKRIIQETRNNTGTNIPWVVARASRLSGQNYSSVINAQNTVISTTESTFAGPLTDNIQPNRPDGAHFENTTSEKGLTLLAEAWNQSLSSQFFSSSVPVLGKGINEISYNCVNQNTASFKLNGNFSSYSWSNNSSNSSIEASNGDVSVLARDAVGNYYQSSKINVRSIYPLITPVISPSISLTACQGKSVELSASVSKYDVNWNNGFIGNKLITTQDTPFFANYRSSQGCLSERSNSLTPKFIFPPGKPTAEVINNEGYVCAGEKLTFKVNNPQNFDIEWSTGQKTPTIELSENLNTPLTVRLYSNFDCVSVSSEAVPFLFLDVPKTPKLIQSGPFSLSVDTLASDLVYEWYLDNKLVSSFIAREISVKDNGFYAVKAVRSSKTPTNKTLTCKSGISTLVSYTKNLNAYGIRVYPNPIMGETFKIAADKELKNAKIEIINSVGQLLSETQTSSIQFPLELKVPNKQLGGKYFLRLSYDGFTRTFPLILE